MVSCANCPTDAQYTYKVTDDLVFNYCALHLPSFLTVQKNAGLLKLVAPVVPAEPVVEKPVSSKKKAAVVPAE